MHWAILLGAVDLIQLAVIILFLLFPLIGQILKGARGAAPGKRPPPQPRPQPRPQANVPGRKPGALRNEIDAFLRRAAQHRGGAPAEEIEIVEPEAIEMVARDRAVNQGAQPKSRLGDGVSAHVEQTIRSNNIGRHTRQLGAAVEQEEEAVEGRLRQVFDHQVGTLENTSGQGDQRAHDSDEASAAADAGRDAPQPDRAGTRAAEVADLLRDPSSLKDAIILAEIFRRPEEVR